MSRVFLGLYHLFTFLLTGPLDKARPGAGEVAWPGLNGQRTRSDTNPRFFVQMMARTLELERLDSPDEDRLRRVEDFIEDGRAFRLDLIA